MIEVRLLVDDIDYDSVADLLMPIVGDKLQEKGGIVGKLGSKQDKLSHVAHKVLGKMSKEKKDQTVVNLAVKKHDLIIEKLSAIVKKKGIGIKIHDVSVRKL